jgi:SAM-dependent methyltransferase
MDINKNKLFMKFYGKEQHPYIVYEKKILSLLTGREVLLDAGCGRDAPVLQRFCDKAGCCLGVDLEDPREISGKIRYLKNSIENIPVESNSVDVVISRAVLEHIESPLSVYREIYRILKTGGRFVFLVPNLWDYVSLLSFAVPNKCHKSIVYKFEGRNMSDVFPAFYKTNTSAAIKRLSRTSGFKILELSYLGQYPSIFVFNRYLFILGTMYEKFICKLNSLRYLRPWILVELQK